MWRNGIAWRQRQPEECTLCQTERKRRCRVLTAEGSNRTELLEEFAAAPYVHPFNQPKYHALICHALHYAKTHKKKVYWVVCLDWPLIAEEEELDIDKLQSLRLQWLGYHDQQTGGIMGMLPLVQDMPLRMTATFYHGALRLYKHRDCIFRGCELEEKQVEEVQAVQEPEVVLTKQPKKLFLEFLDSDGIPFVHALEPTYVTWSRDKGGNAKVQRKGFTVMPDFAGSAHGYCGSTLTQAKGDLLEWHRCPTLEGMLRAYIIRSRVRAVDQLLLVQPYSPMLFAQGTLPGPALLLQAQKGELDEKALRTAWKNVDAKEAEGKKRQETWPWSMPLPCRNCTLQKGKEVRRPLKAYVAIKTLINAWSAIARGADLICFKCQQQLFDKKKERIVSIMCDRCENVLAATHFNEEAVEAWKNLQEDITCKKCFGQKVKRAELQIVQCRGPFL